MPNQPATPNRNIRIDDALWEAGKHIADERGENMSQYVRRLIREDVRRWPQRPLDIDEDDEEPLAAE